MNRRERREVIKNAIKIYDKVKAVDERNSYIVGKGIRRYMAEKDVSLKHFNIITEENLDEIGNSFEDSYKVSDKEIVVKDGSNKIGIVSMTLNEFLNKNTFTINRVAMTDSNWITDADVMTDFRSRKGILHHVNSNSLKEALELRYENWGIESNGLRELSQIIDIIPNEDLIDLITETISLKSRNRADLISRVGVFNKLLDKENFNSTRLGDCLYRMIQNHRDFYRQFGIDDKDRDNAMLLALLNVSKHLTGESFIKNDKLLEYGSYMNDNFMRQHDYFMENDEEVFLDTNLEYKEQKVIELSKLLTKYCKNCVL